jgi:hypothetical protein
MVKCTKGQVHRLKTALRWKGDPQRRQRIQMVLLRESGMTQPTIAGAIGVSLSTVNRRMARYEAKGRRLVSLAANRASSLWPIVCCTSTVRQLRLPVPWPIWRAAVDILRPLPISPLLRRQVGMT